MMNKENFIRMMEQQKKKNGKPYAEKTVNSYANALFWESPKKNGSCREELWQLCREKLQIKYAVCYGDLDKVTLEKVDRFIRENDAAKRLDERIANRTTSNALRVLMRCL